MGYYFLNNDTSEPKQNITRKMERNINRVFLTFRVFGLLCSSLLLHLQRLGRCVQRPSSSVSCCENYNENEDNNLENLNNTYHQIQTTNKKRNLNSGIKFDKAFYFLFWSDKNTPHGHNELI